jgi:hypothetical protein
MSLEHAPEHRNYCPTEWLGASFLGPGSAAPSVQPAHDSSRGLPVLRVRADDGVDDYDDGDETSRMPILVIRNALHFGNDYAGNDYERNLNMQARAGGVARRVRDIDEAAPRADPSPDPCPICFEPMGDRRVTVACTHGFCATCIATWLSEKVTCPVCVRNLGEGQHACSTDLFETEPAWDEPREPHRANALRDLLYHLDAMQSVLRGV